MFASRREREELLEDELSREAIEDDERRIREAYETEIPATVITYIQGADEESTPTMSVLLDDFKCRLMPDVGSIIWIETGEMLRPFKVERYDYIQNASEYDSMRVYIVVHPAQRSHIIPNPYFGINA